MVDSDRFEELQKASTRDVKAVGMVSASTGLEMVEYIRILERKLAQALAAFAEIAPFAEKYADAGGNKGPEMRTYNEADALFQLAARDFNGELDNEDWPDLD